MQMNIKDTATLIIKSCYIIACMSMQFYYYYVGIGKKLGLENMDARSLCLLCIFNNSFVQVMLNKEKFLPSCYDFAWYLFSNLANKCSKK